MTIPPTRLLWLPLTAALLMHWFGLSWLWADLPKQAALVRMSEPLFTRLLVPVEPALAVPSAAPAPKGAGIARSRLRTDALESTGHSTLPLTEPEPEPSEKLAEQAAERPAERPAEEPAAETLVGERPLPQSGADASAEPQGATPHPKRADPLDHWPSDTRLSYKLSGFYQGDLHGSARVQWQRDKANYQVRLSLGTAGLTLATLTSQGEATPTGLVPRVYEESLPGGPRRAEFNGGQVKFQNGNVAPIPDGVQDTVSQFVELTYRFASGRTSLAAGAQVRVWLARPGGMDEWVYDVGELETLQSPQMGPVAAYPLKPRPLANPRGAITAELWFSPSLQYLPVRIRVLLGGGNFVDMVIEQIEQADGAQATSRIPGPSIQ